MAKRIEDLEAERDQLALRLVGWEGGGEQKTGEEASVDRWIEPVMRRVVADFRSLLRQVFEAVDEGRFGPAERLLRDGGIGVLRQSMEMLLSTMEERPLPKDRPCPNCVGGHLKPVGFRPKLLDTSLGSMRIRRRRHVCDHPTCGGNVYPRDLERDLQRDRASPEMKRLAGLLGKEMSFATASSLFENLLGVRCHAKKMQRLATRLGAAMEADRKGCEPVPPECDEAVIHGSSDGTGVPVLGSETAGRRGRAEDGVARTREAKVVTFQSMKKDGKGRFHACDRRVDAAIESASMPDVARDWSPFAQRVRWWATASGYDRARLQVMVADGTAWIWKLWEELFPNAVPILDLFHVRERLRGVANARFGGGDSEAKERQLGWRRRYARLRPAESAPREPPPMLKAA